MDYGNNPGDAGLVRSLVKSLASQRTGCLEAAIIQRAGVNLWEAEYGEWSTEHINTQTFIFLIQGTFAGSVAGG